MQEVLVGVRVLVLVVVLMELVHGRDGGLRLRWPGGGRAGRGVGHRRARGAGAGAAAAGAWCRRASVALRALRGQVLGVQLLTKTVLICGSEAKKEATI